MMPTMMPTSDHPSPDRQSPDRQSPAEAVRRRRRREVQSRHTKCGQLARPTDTVVHVSHPRHHCSCPTRPPSTGTGQVIPLATRASASVALYAADLGADQCCRPAHRNLVTSPVPRQARLYRRGRSAFPTAATAPKGRRLAAESGGERAAAAARLAAPGWDRAPWGPIGMRAAGRRCCRVGRHGRSVCAIRCRYTAALLPSSLERAIGANTRSASVCRCWP